MTQRFVLLGKGIHLPELSTSPDTTDDLQRLEKKLIAEGWSFFYTAWTVTAIGFGFEKRPGK